MKLQQKCSQYCTTPRDSQHNTLSMHHRVILDYEMGITPVDGYGALRASVSVSAKHENHTRNGSTQPRVHTRRVSDPCRYCAWRAARSRDGWVVSTGGKLSRPTSRSFNSEDKPYRRHASSVNTRLWNCIANSEQGVVGLGQRV